jgi:ubiquinone/menaquinone biosynthesis C-methylase UbiE
MDVKINPNEKEELIANLRQMVGGFARTQELYTAVKLGIADILADGSKQAVEIARSAQTQHKALYRFMRVLVTRNILFQDENGAFKLTAMGQFLRSDHPESICNLIIFIGEVNYPVGQGMLYTVQTGRPAFQHIFDMSLFEYLNLHPYLGKAFNNFMNVIVDERVGGIVTAYNFSQFETIVDVGGGNGSLIAAILKKYSDQKGKVFDLPKVVAEAKHNLMQNGIGNRCEFIEGDFLSDPLPKDGDLYILSNIIHDWNDENALQILRNCRQAMHNDNRLLIIEQIMPERVEDGPAVIGSDMGMLMLFDGAQRTEAEHRSLLSSAGFHTTAIIPFAPNRIYNGRKQNWAIIESEPTIE